jgi:predicted nucleic acid-binding protein
LVDSCVILDVMTSNPTWGEWSAGALSVAAEDARLIINPIIYAEISIRFTRIEDLEAALPPNMFFREPLPFEAGFLAGKAFLRCCREGGVRTSALPDFLIGAHAAVAGHILLTREPKRFRTHFPTLKITAPSERDSR